ncbi:MAG TPA: hypothetical protein EYG03_25570 [Planctomycetes bacterium]|nr:hypothetical protein [Fuerstiella sp.]HIK95328.1 hypothetical protein [Planctomycetota bacterium]
MALASPFRGLQFDPASQEPLQLTYEDGSLTTAEPLGKAALRHLMGVWPQAVSVSDICQAACQMLPPSLHQPGQQHEAGQTGAAVLSQALLAAYAAGLVRVFRTPPTVVATVSERPVATPLVRHIATTGSAVVNQWHQNVSGLQPDELLVLSHLNGSNDVAALVTLLEQYRSQNLAGAHADAAGSVPAKERVRAILSQFATERLLLIG